MYKLITQPKTVKATRTVARQFADMEPAPHDRPLKQRRLEVYTKTMQEGGFRPVSWASAACIETNQVYRVNGKHTSYILANWPTDKPYPELFVTIERFQCDSLDDVAKLYATYDSRMQSRTTSDINRSFAACVEELADLPLKIINGSVSGMAYHTYLENYAAIQPAERAEAILENVSFVLWFYDIVKGGTNTNPHLRRVPVIAAMYGSWCKSHVAATEFWSAVRDETGSVPSLPDRKLAKFLLINWSNKGHGDKPTRYQVKDREFYVKCLHAWNAWRKKENTDLRYYPEAKVPSFT